MHPRAWGVLQIGGGGIAETWQSAHAVGEGDESCDVVKCCKYVSAATMGTRRRGGTWGEEREVGEGNIREKECVCIVRISYVCKRL